MSMQEGDASVEHVYLLLASPHVGELLLGQPLANLIKICYCKMNIILFSSDAACEQQFGTGEVSAVSRAVQLGQRKPGAIGSAVNL